MLYSKTENMAPSLSDILLYEVDPRFSRQSGEFAPNDAEIPQGAVLALSPSGQYVPYGHVLEEGQPAVPASEGVQAKDAVPAKLADKAIGILLSRKMEISSEAQPCVVLRRGACVAKDNLFWLSEITDEQKKTALGELESLGIIPKE